MKKITLLLLLFIYLGNSQAPDIKNFKVTANPSNSYTFGNRFDFQFDIKGIYSEIDLFVYYENISNNNLIGLIYWNRDGDNNLVFNNYTLKKNWFNVSYRWYNRQFKLPGKKIILVAKNQGQITQLSYTSPAPSDPKFYLKQATVKQNGETWDFLKNEIPTIETSLNPSDYEETEFNFNIFNNGGTKSRGTWSFFISNKDKLGSGQISIYKFFHRHTLSIPAKEETSRNIKKDIYARLQDGHIWDLYDNKTYYFHVFFEGTSMNPPLWEGSYHYVFPFKVKRLDYSSRALTINPSKIPVTYKIEIYNFSGQKVLSKEVSNMQEENATSLLLPKGIYIIKSKKGDRKVYID